MQYRTSSLERLNRAPLGWERLKWYQHTDLFVFALYGFIKSFSYSLCFAPASILKSTS